MMVMTDQEKKEMNKCMYEKNLKTLKEHDPELYERIINCKTNKIKEITNQNRQLIFQENGKNLYNRIDPHREIKDYISNIQLKEIRIMVFLGFGCGYEFLQVASKKQMIHFWLIIEKNVETFKKAIKYFDIENAYKNVGAVKFLVGLDESELYPAIRDWINLYGKHTFGYNFGVIKQTQSYLLHTQYYNSAWWAVRESIKQIILHYGNDPSDSLAGVENMLNNLDVISKNIGANAFFDKFKGIPAIIVSSGPSLNKNIDLLVKLKNKALILCADGSYKSLLRKGLHPDGVLCIERIPETLPFFKGVSEEDMQKSYLMACPVVVPEVYNVWKGKNIIIYRDFAQFKWLPADKGIMPIGGSVANMGFQIAKNFGCNPIILTGQDLAYGEDGASHVKGAEYAASVMNKQNKIKVKGNYTDFLYSEPTWVQFMKTF